jgi:hypothetical protein
MADLRAARSATQRFLTLSASARQGAADSEALIQGATERAESPALLPCCTCLAATITTTVPYGMLRVVDEQQIRTVADLLAQRNVIDASLAQIIGRPIASGHLGEWIAAAIFDIELESSASARAIDGRFGSGPLAGRTVNIKWYMAHQGLLDTTDARDLDYYLVLTAPPTTAASSRGASRPWCIDAVYLFDARQLRSQQEARGVKLGLASSVTKPQWLAALIYPAISGGPMPVSAQQADLISMFRP